MTKFYKLILVCCAALFLTACAHPDMIKLNDTYDHTVKELGVPDSTTRLPDGSIRIVYSMQPMGQTSYVMIFNPEGRLIFKDQLLQQKYFNQIKPKVQDSQDIYTMFGKPCEQWHYRNLGLSLIHISEPTRLGMISGSRGTRISEISKSFF